MKYEMIGLIHGLGNNRLEFRVKGNFVSVPIKINNSNKLKKYIFNNIERGTAPKLKITIETIE